MKTTPHFFYPSLLISLSFSYLPFLYSLTMLSPILFFSPSLPLFLLFSFSSHHAGLLLALGPAAYPTYSLIVSPDYFSGGHPVCSLHHTVLSSSSTWLEWIRMGGGRSVMLWLVANRWPIGMSINSDKYEGMGG